MEHKLGSKIRYTNADKIRQSGCKNAKVKQVEREILSLLKYIKPLNR